jgi:DNA-binding NtrC family response regulator
MTASINSNATVCNDRNAASSAFRFLGNGSGLPLPAGRLLVADDDSTVRESIKRTLKNAGFDVITVTDGYEAQQELSEATPVAIIDSQMPRARGLDCVRYARRAFPNLPVIIMIEADDVGDAVAAMKEGAFDYIRKPIHADELLIRLHQAIFKLRAAQEQQALRQLMGQASYASANLEMSFALPGLRHQIERIAPLESPVLITGQRGTGKATVARILHQNSPRAAGPFAVVDCATMPRDVMESELFGHCRGAFPGALLDRPGRTEAASGGTLFLNEIAELPLDLQARLVKLLQDRTTQRAGSSTARTVDVRLIAATQQDLTALCQDKRFRDDLHSRLNLTRIHVPALRDRVGEIPALVAAILARLSSRRTAGALRITEGAVTALQGYAWPGNVRELERVLERAAAICQHHLIMENDIVTNYETPSSAHTDKAPHISPLAGRTLADLERQAIIDTLDLCRGNKAQTARVLGISEKSIYNKMRRHGLSKPAAMTTEISS